MHAGVKGMRWGVRKTYSTQELQVKRVEAIKARNQQATAARAASVPRSQPALPGQPTPSKTVQRLLEARQASMNRTKNFTGSGRGGKGGKGGKGKKSEEEKKKEKEQKEAERADAKKKKAKMELQAAQNQEKLTALKKQLQQKQRIARDKAKYEKQVKDMLSQDDLTQEFINDRREAASISLAGIIGSLLKQGV